MCAWLILIGPRFMWLNPNVEFYIEKISSCPFLWNWMLPALWVLFNISDSAQSSVAFSIAHDVSLVTKRRNSSTALKMLLVALLACYWKWNAAKRSRMASKALLSKQKLLFSFNARNPSRLAKLFCARKCVLNVSARASEIVLVCLDENFKLDTSC